MMLSCIKYLIGMLDRDFPEPLISFMAFHKGFGFPADCNVPYIRKEVKVWMENHVLCTVLMIK